MGEWNVGSWYVVPPPSKYRKHHKLIKKWAENKDAKVYFWVSHLGWQHIPHPTFDPTYDHFAVILPEHQVLWDAYLKGDLQCFVSGAGWVTTKPDNSVPLFHSRQYRVRPNPVEEKPSQKNRRVKIVCQDGSVYSFGPMEKVWESVGETGEPEDIYFSNL